MIGFSLEEIGKRLRDGSIPNSENMGIVDNGAQVGDIITSNSTPDTTKWIRNISGPYLKSAYPILTPNVQNIEPFFKAEYSVFNTAGVTNFIDSTYGNGRYISLYKSSFSSPDYVAGILTSLDGIKWSILKTPKEFGLILYLKGITFVLGKFYIAFIDQDNNSHLFSSADGLSWSEVKIPISGYAIDKIKSTNNNLVLILKTLAGESGTLLTSTVEGIFTFRSVFTLTTTKDITDISFGSSVFVLTCNSGEVYSSPTLVTWTLRTSNFGVNAVYAITYKGTFFTIVGAAGTLATSTDGTTWTLRTSGTANNIFSVTTDGTTVVYMEANGILGRSTDGITWTTYQTGTGSGSWCKIVYGNSLWVCSISNPTIYTTTDLISITTVVQKFWTGSAFAGGYFNGKHYLAIANYIYSKTYDDDLWTLTATVSGVTTIYYMSYLGGQFQITGSNGYIATSADAISWTPRTSGIAVNIFKLIWTGTTYIAIGATGYVGTSPDLVTWTTRTQPNGTTLISDIDYDSTKKIAYLISGNRIWNSLDQGTTWTMMDYNPNGSSTLTNIRFGNSNWVISTASGTYVTKDFKSTLINNTHITPLIYGLLFANNMFIALYGTSPAYKIATSYNGLSWKETNISTLQPSVAFQTFARLLFYKDSIKFTSSNGSHNAWDAKIGLGSTDYVNSLECLKYVRTTINTLSSQTLIAITYGFDRYLAATNGNILSYSLDGITWTGTTNIGSVPKDILVTKDGTLGVVVATNGSIWTTTTGATWTARTSGVATALNSITTFNNIIVVVGDGGVILRSIDGITWTSSTSGTTENLNKVIYNNGIFTAVGNAGRILTSADGTTWTVVTLGAFDIKSIVVVDNVYYFTTYLASGESGFLYRTKSQSIVNLNTFEFVKKFANNTIIFAANNKMFTSNKIFVDINDNFNEYLIPSLPLSSTNVKFINNTYVFTGTNKFLCAPENMSLPNVEFYLEQNNADSTKQNEFIRII